MTFVKAVKSNLLQTIRFTHNLSNDVFTSNNTITKEDSFIVASSDIEDSHGLPLENRDILYELQWAINDVKGWHGYK